MQIHVLEVSRLIESQEMSVQQFPSCSRVMLWGIPFAMEVIDDHTHQNKLCFAAAIIQGKKKLLHAICFASAFIQKKLETLIYFENSEVLFWENGVCCNTGKERRKESL